LAYDVVKDMVAEEDNKKAMVAPIADALPLRVGTGMVHGGEFVDFKSYHTVTDVVVA
jgi:hypothetical protein